MTKVSIITVCYNSAITIEDTIKSVINQDYKNIEYIILDGQSKDNTISIIEKYKEQIAVFKSELDNGMYDALNKGIDLASGEIIAILNSDDFYINNHVISKVVDQMTSKGVDALYGDLWYVDQVDTNKIIRKWISGEYKPGLFLKGWMPPHPAFFVKKSVYEQHGKFDLSLQSASDYELMLRFIHKHKVSITYLPEVLVKMRIGGTSNASFKNRVRANKEDRKAWSKNELTPKWYTLILKPLSKIRQYF